MAPALSPANSLTLPLWYASRARATVEGSSPIGVGAVGGGGAGEVGFGSYSSTTFLPPRVRRGRGGVGAAVGVSALAVSPVGAGVGVGGGAVGGAVGVGVVGATGSGAFVATSGALPPVAAGLLACDIATTAITRTITPDAAPPTMKSVRRGIDRGTRDVTGSSSASDVESLAPIGAAVDGGVFGGGGSASTDGSLVTNGAGTLSASCARTGVASPRSGLSGAISSAGISDEGVFVSVFAGAAGEGGSMLTAAASGSAAFGRS